MRITFKKVLKCFVPYGFIVARNKIRQYKVTGQKKCFGNKNPDITFYIVRRNPPGAGLFSNFHWVLGHIMYALEKGYTPIVDMEKYKTFFNENFEIDGTYNAWEYYFKQPKEYTLKEVYKSRNVVLADMNHYFHDRIPYQISCDQKYILHLNTFISKYLQFNKKTLNYINEQKLFLFKDYTNILGVKYRGSDYIAELAPGHFIPANLEETIEKTKELYDEWNMEWVYLSTEETIAVDEFRKVFADKIIVTNSMRIENYTKNMGSSSEINFGRKNDNYLKGLEYIVDTVLLSECDALIAPKNNGTMAAIELNNNKYTHIYIFEKGAYENIS